MKKKTLYIIFSVCILLMFIVIVAFISNKGKREEALTDNVLLQNSEVGNTESVSVEDRIEDYSATMGDDEINESTIFYYVENSVNDNQLFLQFINYEITACDIIVDSGTVNSFDYYGKEFYLYELFHGYQERYANEYHQGINGVQIMSRDLNEDKQNELLVMIEYQNNEADLHVFEEVDEKLYAWEYYEGLRTMRRSTVEFYECGIIGRWGSGGGKYSRYNEEGKIEDVLVYNYRQESQQSTGMFINYYELFLYENGDLSTELAYQEYDNRLEDKQELTVEDQAIKEQCDSTLLTLEQEYGEPEYIVETRYLEDVELISYEQLVACG